MSADLFWRRARRPPSHRRLPAERSRSNAPSAAMRLGGVSHSSELDPCSPGVRRPWDTAAKHYGIEGDGLRQPWEGRVWLNPPYAHSAKWMARLAEHGTGTALLFARTETRMWFDHVWPKATGLLFLRGRLKFTTSTARPRVPLAHHPSLSPTEPQTPLCWPLSLCLAGTST